MCRFPHTACAVYSFLPPALLLWIAGNVAFSGISLQVKPADEWSPFL